MNFNLYIYILYMYHQSNLLNFLPPTLLVTLLKRNIVFVREVLEQPGSKTRVYNVVTIHELCHANVDKQSKLLADIDITLPRGAVWIT